METFLYFFQQGIIYPISELINLLQDQTIARRFFGNSSITLWTVLLVFFIGMLVIKFILRPFPLAYKTHPIDLSRSRRSDDSSDGD